MSNQMDDYDSKSNSTEETNSDYSNVEDKKVILNLNSNVSDESSDSSDSMSDDEENMIKKEDSGDDEDDEDNEDEEDDDESIIVNENAQDGDEEMEDVDESEDGSELKKEDFMEDDDNSEDDDSEKSSEDEEEEEEEDDEEENKIKENEEEILVDSDSEQENSKFIPQVDGMNDEEGEEKEELRNEITKQTIMQDLNDSEDDEEFNPNQPGIESDNFDTDSDFDDDSLHPERPERIVSIYLLLRSNSIFQKCFRLPAREATDEELCYVHTPEYIKAVDNFHASGGSSGLNYEQGDVYINKYTHQVARVAAGSVCALTESVCKGELDNGFAIVRSPGHHAEREKAMGFCIYSNVAIAAKLAKEKYNKKVLVIDWDVHHGNGTQNALYQDDDILFISIHRCGRDFYPFTSGYINEIGDAPGYNINIAFPGSYYSNDLIAAFSEIVLPVAHQFNPDLVLVSAGFDAVEGDRWGNSHVAPETFGVLTNMLSSVASGKLVLALEGGYNLSETAKSVSHCMKVLLGDPPIYPNTYDDPPLQKFVLDAVKLKLSPYWSCLNPPINSNTIHKIVKNHENEFKEEFMKNKRWRYEVINEYGKRILELPQNSATKKKRLDRQVSKILTESGSGEAFYSLASMYYNGDDYKNTVDFEKAYQFSKLAADYLNPEGMRLLGVMYRKGQFVEQNDRQSYSW
eukprot:CAMPEP_0117418930 /NCGR_PEP_ID=MMETSP0758-20121206/614_1 /TAXON_ID=63605 /ORGANISM="Percolomonas cosmopolitus, Strain AE-1 (ATCC 50343)" /LENGTH=686 /DNA_ID=CAMNT_0005199731 /DNA_START=712 /DNA_END=2769 /DNA_ORIENTATION=-